MARFCLAFLTLLVTACTVNDANETPGTLVQVNPVQPGSDCEYGGVAIESGVDTNMNGVLDPSEVTSTQYVCNGASSIACGSASSLSGEVSIQSAADLGQIGSATCIDGDLVITNTDLTSMPELAGIDTVTGSVYVVGNSALPSLSDLSGLIRVGDLYVVQANPALTSVGALGGLQHVQSIQIIDNATLPDLSGLETITDLDAGLNITGNDGLTSLTGLDNLVTSSQGIDIESNNNLTSTDALAHLVTIATLDISSNAALPSISLAALTDVRGSLTIDENAALTDVSLPVLSAASNGIVVEQDGALLSLDVPELLLTGALDVTSDTVLTSITAPKLAIDATDLELIALPAIQTASFPVLGTIGGNVSLSAPLASFDGFSALTSIGGQLYVEDVTAADFSGFGSLQSVAGNVTISQNQNLAAFSGLTSFTRVGGNLTVTSNPSLMTAVAQAFAAAITVVGTVTIQ
jgi:hypothetical protein